jgi:hypothetical protein
VTAPIVLKNADELALRAQDLYLRMAAVVLPVGDELDAMSLLCALLLLEKATFEAAEMNGLDRDVLKRQLREMFPDGIPQPSEGETN